MLTFMFTFIFLRPWVLFHSICTTPRLLCPNLSHRYNDFNDFPTRISPRTTENVRAGMNGVTTRGRHLFASVYDPHTEKLLAKLGSYHPDFPGMCMGFPIVVFPLC